MWLVLHVVFVMFIDLERLAFMFAVICIVACVISVVAGGYGSIAHSKLYVMIASATALISG